MVIGAIISFALLDMVSGSMRSMSKADQSSQAYELVDELTEFTRASGYNRLLKFINQTFTMTINKTDGVQLEGTVFHNRPLLLDSVRRQWHAKSVQNKFEGIITYFIFDGPEPGTLNVAIDLHWTDRYTSAEQSLGRVIIVIDVPEEMP